MLVRPCEFFGSLIVAVVNTLYFCASLLNKKKKKSIFLPTGKKLSRFSGLILEERLLRESFMSC